MCDHEPASVLHEEWFKARKPHRCDECAGWITSGDRYQQIRAVWDHQWGSLRTCVECVQVRDWYVDTLPRWSCGPVFGGLYDAMPRESWPQQLIEAQAALRAERMAA